MSVMPKLDKHVSTVIEPEPFSSIESYDKTPSSREVGRMQGLNRGRWCITTITRLVSDSLARPIVSA